MIHPLRTPQFWGTILLMVAVLLLGGLWVDAYATSVIVGGNPVGSDFSCMAGSPVGYLLQVSPCPTDVNLEEGRVFSFFICQFETILNETLSKVYCAVVDNVTPVIMAALTLFIVFMGVGFLIGMVPFTAKELFMLGLKFTMVLTFATQAEFMIGLGYNLFVNFAKEGIVIVIDALFSISYDEGLAASLEGYDTFTGFNSVNDVYLLFDIALQDMLGMASLGEAESNDCQNAIFTMLVVVAVVVPPMAFVAIFFLFKLLWMMLRAVFGYCQGLLGLTFMVVLSPIYIAFALFKPTRTLFDKWVKYLTSFAFQMVVVFAFLGMVFYIIAQMGDELDSYRKLVHPQKQTVSTAPNVFNFVDTCGICEMKKMEKPDDKPECLNPRDPKVLPLSEMSKDENLLRFLTIKVLTMLVLFYVLEMMMSFVPEMAKHLAGPKYSAQIGGGAGGNVPIPGEGGVSTIFRSAGAAFISSQNSAGGTVNAVREAVAQGIVGDRGMVDSMIRSVANPIEPFRVDNPNENVDRSPAGNLFGAAAGLTAMGAGAAAMFGAAKGAGDGSSDTLAGGGGDDTASGHQGDDFLGTGSQQAGLSQNQFEADRLTDSATYNPGLANTIRQAVSIDALGEDPSDQAIGDALAIATGGYSEAQIKAAIANMDMNELSNAAAAYLRAKIMIG